MCQNSETNPIQDYPNEMFRFIADDKGIKRVFIGAYPKLENLNGERAPKGCFLTVQITPGFWPHETEYLPVSVMRGMFEKLSIEEWQAPYAYEIFNQIESEQGEIDPDIIEMLGNVDL
ncbi:MAG TPA: hypothetical protein VHO70_18635 [Chitinispirillaceae bacterium]|nr:hypothetical protein [Chitinispirillaceae bacterium]